MDEAKTGQTLEINSYSDLVKWFRHYDSQAKMFKNRRFVPAWIAGIVLGVAAVYCFALMIVFGVDDRYKLLVNTFEVVSLIGSFVLLTKVANHWYASFLFTRRIAEVLRNHIILADHHVSMATKQIRCISTDAIADATDAELPEGDFVIIINPIQQDVTQQRDQFNFKDSLIAVLDAQIAHHQSTRLKVFRQRRKHLHIMLTCVKYAFLVVVLAKYAVEVILDPSHQADPWHHVSQVLSFYVILLPTLFAALEGVKHFSDWQRNINIAAQKIKELNALKKEIQVSPEEDLPAWTTRLLFNLESENSDWLVRNASRKLEPLI